MEITSALPSTGIALRNLFMSVFGRRRAQRKVLSDFAEEVLCHITEGSILHAPNVADYVPYRTSRTKILFVIQISANGSSRRQFRQYSRRSRLFLDRPRRREAVRAISSFGVTSGGVDGVGERSGDGPKAPLPTHVQASQHIC